MTQIEVTAPAKLNLYLRVLSRREDGYHNLQTLFQLIDLQDRLIFETNTSGDITLDAPQCEFPSNDNLIIRAAKYVNLSLTITPAATLNSKKTSPSEVV